MTRTPKTAATLAHWTVVTTVLGLVLFSLTASALQAQQSAHMARFELSDDRQTVTLRFDALLSAAQTTDTSDYRLFEIGGADIRIDMVERPNSLQLVFALDTPLALAGRYRLEIAVLNFEYESDEDNRVVDLADFTKGVLVGTDGLNEIVVRFPMQIDTSALPTEVAINGRDSPAKCDVAGSPPLFLRVRLSDAVFFNKASVQITGVKSLTEPAASLTFSGTIKRPVPKGRDDARQYFRLGLLASEGTSTQFNLDAKIAETFLNLGRGWTLNGSFDGQISSGGAAAANRLVFAAGLGAVILGAGALDALRGTGDFVVETDKDFRNTNLLGDFDFFFSFPALTWARLRWDETAGRFVKRRLFGYLNPYLGFEVGGPSFFGKDEVPNYTVARVTGRLAFNASISLSKAAEVSLSFDVQYAPRYLLTDEIVTVEATDAAGEKVLVQETIESGWINYFEFSTNLNVTAHTGFGVKYQNGKIPPNFQQIDQLTAGFTLMF